MKLFRLVLTVLAITVLTAAVFAADQNPADLYKSNCQGCHGADGKGSVFGKKMGAKDFHDPAVVKMSPSELITITTDGKNRMPPYKGKLTDDQIKALAKYIKEIK